MPKKRCERCGRRKREYLTLTLGDYNTQPLCPSSWCRAVKYVSWAIHGITGGRVGGYSG